MQRDDPYLPIASGIYLNGGILPADDKDGRELSLSTEQLVLLDNVLYSVDLCVI